MLQNCGAEWFTTISRFYGDKAISDRNPWMCEDEGSTNEQTAIDWLCAKMYDDARLSGFCKGTAKRSKWIIEIFKHSIIIEY